MSFEYPLQDIDSNIKKWLRLKCKVRPNSTMFNKRPDAIQCYDIRDDHIQLPLGCWSVLYDEFPNVYKYPRANIKCSKQLFTLVKNKPGFVYDKEKKYRDQDVVFEQGFKHLKKNHTLFLALATGFGKTSLANYFACHLKLKFVVICFFDMVRKQWINEFQKYSNAYVQDLSSAKKIDKSADGYIVGTLKSSKMKDIDFSFIGLVIFDEAHVSTVTALTKSLLYFTPKYLIGLSATPERSDGMNSLFDLYFGSSKNFLVRKEVKEFQVFKVETCFKPTIKYERVRGKMTLKWSLVESSLAENNARIEMIYNIIMRHPDKRPIILNKLQESNIMLYDYLVSKGLDVELLIDKKKEWRQDAHILVAGVKKAGVGFDDPTRDMLIMMISVKDVRQNEGRIRCSNNIIYDIVDNHRTLENHWNGTSEYTGRYNWYIERGATVSVLTYDGKKFTKGSTRDITDDSQASSIPWLLGSNKKR